jgi:hypothetical protein
LQAARWLLERDIVVVTDNSYAAIDLLRAVRQRLGIRTDAASGPIAISGPLSPRYRHLSCCDPLLLGD